MSTSLRIHGRFAKSPDAAAVAAEACRFRADGLTYRQIADRQRCSVSTAHDRVKRCLMEASRDPAVALLMRALEWALGPDYRPGEHGTQAGPHSDALTGFRLAPRAERNP